MRMLTLFAALTLAAPPSPAATATPAQPVPADPATHRLTLLTGDVVTFTDTDRPTFVVDPARRAGATPVTFVAEQRGDDFYVIPSDARARIDGGTVDPELFNVRGLVRQGLAGTSRPLPVIVAAQRATSLPAATTVRELPVLDGAAMTVDRARAAEFWSTVDKMEHVWLDQRLRVSLDESVPRIGAPTAWQGGHDGRGVRVAVLDTGVDASHPDLTGKVADTKDFTGEGPADTYGHGTHVAATIAGGGTGRFTGVAPGATLMSGKVCGADGTCPSSAILAGMDWAARSGARVINLSLGGEPTDGTDPLSRAVDRLTNQTGALFVVAAGNFGCPVCVSTPAAANLALAVGAVDKTDALAGFSSRGPRLTDGAVKPELVAPGVAITAARAEGTELGTPVDDHYTTASGTSMATPHVAGAAALLAQAHPGWPALRLKHALVSTAKDTGSTAFEQGAGRVDVARAYEQRVFGPAALNFGRVKTGGTRQLTYTNDTAAPVTLTLGVRFRDYAGAPADVARLNTTTLTVPAGGVAAAFLTIKPFSAAPGVYSGLVTATTQDRSVSLRTPISYYLLVPTTPVTVRLLDFDGKPVAGEGWAVLGGGVVPNDPFHTEPYQTVPLRDGVGTVRVPAGKYTGFAWVIDRAGGRAAWVAATNVPVGKATELVLDARKAVPSTVSTPDSATVVDHQLLFSYDTPTSSWSSAIAGRNTKLYATPVPPVDGPAALVLQDHATLLRPGEAFYNLNYSQDDGIPGTLEHRPDPANLIAIGTRYHADRPNLTLTHAWWGFRAGASGTLLMPRVSHAMPVALTEYVNRDDRVAWTRYAHLSTADNKNVYAMYNRGPFPATERWFEGPVAPAIPGFNRIGGTGPDVLRPTPNINDSVPNHLLDVDFRGEYPITWRLFHGDQEIPARSRPGFQTPEFPMPAGPGTFTLRSSLVLRPTAVVVPSLATRWHSPRVDTEWTFTSAAATGPACTFGDACDPQPILQLSHDLGLSLHNEAPAGAEHTVRVTATHQRNAVGAAPVERLTVAYSTDEGATWHDAPTSQVGAGSYEAVLTNPGPGGTVWLRTSAADGAGNTVTQTVQRAYSTS